MHVCVRTRTRVMFGSMPQLHTLDIGHCEEPTDVYRFGLMLQRQPALNLNLPQADVNSFVSYYDDYDHDDYALTQSDAANTRT